MSDEEEVPTVTNEIPVSLDRLALIHKLTHQYMRIKGLFYVLIGLTWVVVQSPSRLAGIEWLDILSPTGVGVIWIVGGFVPIIASYTRADRLKQLGWFMLIFVSALFGAYFFISWLIYYLPFVEAEGYQRGAVTTVSYWAYSASAYIMALIHSYTKGAVEGVHN